MQVLKPAALSLALALGAFAQTQAGDVRVRMEQGGLARGGDRFVVRGLAYSVVPGMPCLYARDLPLIAAMGANTVRTYGLVAEGDKIFSELLDSTRLHWLAGFPLDPYYDPAQPISAQKAKILQGLRDYAWRFRGQQRLIGYVFGQDVARDYARKFAGAPEEFYQLIGEAAAVLKEIEPQATPLLTTSVGAPEELAREAPGLSFWSLDGYPGRAALGRLQTQASRPVLISEYAADAAPATAKLAATIEGDEWLLGGVYAGYVDRPGQRWRGVFASTATEQRGLDSLRPRQVFYTLAGLWGGSFPAAWEETRRPRLAILEDGTPQPETTSPGGLVRLSGDALLHASPPYTDDGWPLHLATNCLCVGAAPARMRLLSPNEVSAQVPWTVEPGERSAVFFRAGAASNFLRLEVRQFSADTRPGPVLEARGAASRAAVPALVPGPRQSKP